MESSNFSSRAADLISQAQSGRRIETGFLTPLEQSVLISKLKNSALFFHTDGGLNNAERRIFCICAQPIDIADCALFDTLKIEFFKQELEFLTHRNILGSLLGLGLKRSMIGDILIGQMCAYVFVVNHKTQYIIDNLVNVGRANVRVSVSQIDSDFALPSGTVKKSTLASLRLDNVLALGLSISRQKACELIKSESVLIDHVLQTRPSKEVGKDSVISIRKHGRIVLREVSDKSTKKNRTWVELECFR
jgi:RNA-binding protein YlmH